MLAPDKRGPLRVLTFFGSVVIAASYFVAACTTTTTEVDPSAPDGGSSDPNPTANPPGSSCATGGDCRSGVCTDGLCQSSSPTDNTKNGDETDVDCGGPGAPPCALGKQCKGGTDCATGKCEGGTCVVDPSKPPGPTDGIKNNGETDVDCGGPDAATPRCKAAKDCGGNGDCETPLTCNEGKCGAKPTPTDKIKNGTETDVDCGGADAATPRCKSGQACLVHADCETGCNFEKKCATRPSCTQLEGGSTCGPQDVLTKQNDCCETAAVGAYKVDKYQVTAGRMRAFLDRYNGNLQQWAAALPAGTDGWSATDNAKLPTNMAEANNQLGPFYGKRSCQTGYETGHVFWTPATAEDFKDLPQNVLDAKALNCVPWHMLRALCAFDGGHLATEAELTAAYYNNGTPGAGKFPWGAAGGYSTGGDGGDKAVQRWAYLTPNTPATARKSAQGGFLDVTVRIAPPGRKAGGYNTTGHADLVGNLLEWVGDQDRAFIWKGSFENHAQEADNQNAGANDPFLPRMAGGARWVWGSASVGTGRPDDVTGNVSSQGYYGIGGRCARK